ncbi:class I SAM-dependent methyltransferase [Alteromonadaceae bacterium BrNp21-10]|nr:class I SAM-dependent methyltransferase [Alteromonadaceae bacterium BrNp21-10]
MSQINPPSHSSESADIGKQQQAYAYFQQSLAYRDQGQLRPALQGLRHALKLAPERRADIAQAMASILVQIAPTQYQAELAEDLLICFSEPTIDHQHLATLAALQLLAKYDLVDLRYGESVDLSMLMNKRLMNELKNDGLLMAFLSQCININAPMEWLLIQFRQYILLGYQRDGVAFLQEQQSLLVALATQSFANQYIWPIQVDEAEQLLLLAGSLGNSESSEQTFLLLLLATYQPLTDISQWDVSTLDWSVFPEQCQQLIQRSVIDVMVERQVAQALPSFSAVDDQISNAVRAQYESCPYPRWTIPPAGRMPALTQVLRQLPRYVDPQNIGEPIQLLVAGCGTGYEPIEISRMQSDLQVTAIDLSRNSLAYGLNKAQELAIDNVQFIQGDILQVVQLNKHFDVVVSTGVLHHMADTLAGWQSLYNVTQTGGVMRISLYSELARRRVVQGREKIATMGLSTSLVDMQRFRQYLFTEAQGELAELASSDDLYSLSGCRDLLFHEQEQRFNFHQIGEMAQQLGLKMIGLDWPSAAVHQQFRTMFPEPETMFDFAKLNEFEQRYPDAFLTMYQIWWQK